jgi:mannose-6-phosphate isomerase-like protein (cupin superfamily)
MASKDPQTFQEWFVESSYQDFVKREGAPLYQGSALEDLANLELGDWERRGGKVAYTRLGNQEDYSLQVIEIPPGGQLKPERHIYEAIMFVMQGQGATTVWQEGEPKHTVEWQEGSLLAIPLNAWHQEFNASGSEPAKIFFGTNMARVINLYHNLDFVFDNPFVFSDRYSYDMQKFYADEGKHWTLRLLQTNFIPDIRKFDLDTYPERGQRTSIMRLSMADASIGLHVMDVGTGTYATAHRHQAGAHVIVIDGEGYENMFMPGEKPIRKYRANPYAVVAPKLNEFHQHFNTGTGQYRMLAFRGTGLRYGEGRMYDPAETAQTTDPHAWSYMIPFDREDPEIREWYWSELEKNGIDLRLEPINQGRS